MALKPYKTLIKDAQDEFIINKSRFIGHGRPCETEEAALAFLAEMRTKYKDATHNCYAYIIGANMGVMRYSDDGEPGGTAGMPIIEVMKARGVTSCAVVVTRYFGGVLLGAGGLFRAYTKSAKDALDAAGRSVVRRWVALKIPCSYAALERYKQEILSFDGAVEELDYGAAVTILALIPEERAEAFSARILDISGGAVAPSVTGERLQPVPLP